MMSEFKNQMMIQIELPRSTQSFENMLDEVGLTPDNVTRTKTCRTVSTTFSDIFHLTCYKNREEIEEIAAADKEAGYLISDGNSLSNDSICTACTQCKLAKELKDASDDIGIVGIEAENGSSLFVDQINSETEIEGQENHPKRSFSDTLTGSRCVVPEYLFSKRFKSEGFCSASQLRLNSPDGKIEGKRVSTSYCHEAPSESSKLCNEKYINVREELLKASPDPGEHISEESAQIESANNVVDRGTASSQTLEVGDSTIAQRNIEEVGFENEAKDDDDSKSAAATLDHEILSPNPTVSTFSQSTIEEVYQIEDHDHETGGFAIPSHNFSDLTISQSTIEEIYHIDATDNNDCPNSSIIAERLPQDSEKKERLPRDSEGEERFPRNSEKKETLPKDSEGEERLPRHSKEKEWLPKNSEGEERLPRHSEEKERLPRDSGGEERLLRHSEEREKLPRDSEGAERLPRHSEEKERLPRHSEEKERLPRDCEGEERLLRDSQGEEWPLQDSEETERSSRDFQRSNRPPQDSEKEDGPSQREILRETAITPNIILQIDAGSDNVEKQRIETNPDNLDLGCIMSSKSGTEEKNQPVLKNLETQEESAKESLNSATEIGNRGPDIDPLKNGDTLRLRDESFLEVSIDSEKTYIEMNSRDKREERATRAPVDLTSVNKKCVYTEDARAGSSREFDRRDDLGARKREEKATEVTNPVRALQDPLENFTPITESKKSRSDVDDTCLDLLSESELARIEKEAYTKSTSTRIATNLKNVSLGEEDRFYRPQRLITDTENNEDLVLPSWVTNPAPEPNYEMMRHRKRSQKEYVNKILPEVLRLSEIISKVVKAVREERRDEDPDSAGKHVPRIQDPTSVQSAETYRTSDSRASSSRENRDLFYVPQPLSRPKQDGAPNLAISRPVKLEAPVNPVDGIRANCSVEIGESEKLYAPRSGGSKYDPSFIFSGQTDKLNISKASCSHDKVKASSFYNPSVNSGSSERDWSGDKTMEYSGGTAALDDRIFQTRTSRESQLPKENFQASFVSDNRCETGNGNIDGINNRKTVAKDAVFYSSDNLSSASRKYIKLPSVENDQIFFSKSLVSEGFGSDSIQARPTSLNFGCNLTARTNESIFYSGNK